MTLPPSTPSPSTPSPTTRSRTISRRRFLTLGGCAGVVFATGCSPLERALGTKPISAAQPSPATQPHPADAGAAADTVLVVVQLLGGNDGLNTLVPAAGFYHDARPSLALADDDLIALAGTNDFGMHPALAPLLPLWEAGTLAGAVGVGFEDQDRSHFRSRDIWWRAGDDPSADGWLARWMDLAAIDQPDQPMEAIAFGAGARALSGAGAATVGDPVGLTLTPPEPMSAGAYEAILLDLARSGPGEPALLELARIAAPTALSTQKILTDAVDESVGSAYVERNEPTLDLQLGTAAALIRSRPELRVVTLGIEGFDTHVDQQADHAALLADLATSLTRFWTSLDERDRARTLVLTTSEFGRRVAENGSAGTDHGRAGAHFLLGGGVAGGQIIGSHGERADENGDVAITVPSIDLYADALHWLGGPVDDVLGLNSLRTGLLG